MNDAAAPTQTDEHLVQDEGLSKMPVNEQGSQGGQEAILEAVPANNQDVLEPDARASGETSLSDDEQNNRSWRHLGKRALQSVVISAQVLPTNGILRFGPGAAAYAATKDPFIAGAVVGSTTTLLEGAAGLATADLQAHNPDSRLFQGIRKLLGHKKINPLIVSKDGKLLPVAESLTALYAGTPAAMVAKESVMTESEVSKRTYEDRKKYSLKMAAALGAICTAQGYFYALGVDNYDDPKVVAGVGAVVGTALYVQKKAADRLQRKNGQDQEPVFTPRYDLDDEEYRLLETDLVSRIENEYPEEGIYTVWLKPDSEYSNLIRTREAEYFPEVKELDPEVESNTTFLAFIDTRPDAKRLVHATTLSFPEDQTTPIGMTERRTGFITVDQLIDMGNFDAKEFEAYYDDKKVDIRACVSVDTNFRVGDWRPGISGLSITDLAYVSIFKYVDQRLRELAVATKDGGAFCSINQASINSFIDFGMDCELLMGRQDLVTPESLEGKQYLPVFVRADKNAKDLFSGLVSIVNDVYVD